VRNHRCNQIKNFKYLPLHLEGTEGPFRLQP
jgi:hypothetical protein